MFCASCIDYPTIAVTASLNEDFEFEKTNYLPLLVSSTLKKLQETIQPIQSKTCKINTICCISSSVSFSLACLFPSNWLIPTVLGCSSGLASGAVVGCSANNLLFNTEMQVLNLSIQLFNDHLGSFIEEPEDVKISRIFDIFKTMKAAWHMVNFILDKQLPPFFKDGSDYFFIMEFLSQSYAKKAKSTEITEKWNALKDISISNKEDYVKFWNAIGLDLWEAAGSEKPLFAEHLINLETYKNRKLLYIPAMVTNIFITIVNSQYAYSEKIPLLLLDTHNVTTNREP